MEDERLVVPVAAAGTSTSIESSTGEPRSRRLPTNPRRRRVPPEQRKRSARACNACNVRRVKCSGSQPCSRCLASSRTCEYPREEEKILVSKESYHDLQRRYTVLQSCLAEVVPSPVAREVLVSKLTESPKNATEGSAASQSQLDESEQRVIGDGRILKDPEGYTRYLGESSGAAFTDRLREFVSTIIPLVSDANGETIESTQRMFTALLGQYHAHDSRPFVLPTIDPFYIPDDGQLRSMISTFQFYAGDMDGASPSGGIYYWGTPSDLIEQAEAIVAQGGLGDDPTALCNLNAILALAGQYEPSLALPWELSPGETYFSRAKFLLMNPLEDASLVRMRILCLMGHYMLGVYRRDAAYMYICLAAQIGVIHGLHKGWMVTDQGAQGERRKREFWNTFILDRWLSCLMGRPGVIAREAITIGLPETIPGSDLPPATGLREHVKLSMIMDDVVNTVYNVSGQSFNSTHRVDVIMQKLFSWKADLPLALQFSEGGALPDRATLILHMIYNQLVILCARPSLFLAVKQAVASKYISRNEPLESPVDMARLEYGAEAARAIVVATKQLIGSNQATIHASVDYHFPHNAAIVLGLVQLIPEITIPTDEESTVYLVGALKDFAAQGNESAGDCAKICSEFLAVVKSLKLHSQTRRSRTLGNGAMRIDSPSAQQPVSHTTPDMFGKGYLLNLESLGGEQGMLYDEMYSWLSESLG